MTSRPFARKPLAFLVPTLVFAAGPLPAAHAEDSGFELEEIVVTARKRQENLQHTPLAVSAFSGENLEQRGIVNIAGLNKAVPGIEVQAGNGVAGVANIYIRGVGQRNTEPNLDSGVGVYLDGVYISRSDGALLDMNDVASVQVLRGPQGTLFGKNTTGGALLIETNRPAQEFEGKASVTVGNYDQLDGQPGGQRAAGGRDALHAALADVGRARRLHRQQDARHGIQRRRPPQRHLAVALAARREPHRRSQSQLRRDRAAPARPAVPAVLGQLRRGLARTLQNGFVKPSYGGKSLEDFCLDSASTAKDETLQDLGGGYWADNTGASLTLNWEITREHGAEEHQRVAQYAGRPERRPRSALDPVPAPQQRRASLRRVNAIPTSTARSSTSPARLHQRFALYIAGLYYFNEETTDSTHGRDHRPVLHLRTPATPPGPTWCITTAPPRICFTDNEAWRAFLQGDWSLGGELGPSPPAPLHEGDAGNHAQQLPARTSPVALHGPLSASRRWTGTHRGLQHLLMKSGSFNPLTTSADDVDSDDVDYDAWTPLVSLSYQIEDVGFIQTGNAYLTGSKGFRSGGLSEAPSAYLEDSIPRRSISTESVLSSMRSTRLRANVGAVRSAVRRPPADHDRGLAAGPVSPAPRSTPRSRACAASNSRPPSCRWKTWS